jgi:ubiquinone/menaquinone biosynthesis C-methylase UbiE
MHSGLKALLNSGGFVQKPDGIYSAQMPFLGSVQNDERELRERVAAHRYDNYLAAIARSHSIPVMDKEVDRFLAKMPKGALILDIGGCWGWHWRRIAKARPDIGVLIIDFVRPNLTHAINVLGTLLDEQVALMHADATALPFITDRGLFDGIWTVQTFQHIPDFTNAVKEAHRVLKPGGYFINYSLHNTPLNKLIHKLLSKPYHSEGIVKNTFYLTRANNSQLQIIEDIFGSKVLDGYAECLFHPDLKLTFTGRLGSPLGTFDVLLNNILPIGYFIARQRIFGALKS